MFAKRHFDRLKTALCHYKVASYFCVAAFYSCNKAFSDGKSDFSVLLERKFPWAVVVHYDKKSEVFVFFNRHIRPCTCIMCIFAM